MTSGDARVFSGIQPTGDLHLGNWLGAIERWIELTDRYECIYAIVDLHAITVPCEPEALRASVIEVAVALLAAGLDPDRCILYVQSDVAEHAQLAWLLNTVTPLGELTRMTQFKDKSERVEAVSAGLLNYPVLQAADILLFRAGLVPVGEDQRQHLELAREIARRWNARFGELFPEPQPLIGAAPRVLGLDGVTKMSKSQDNTIPMLAGPDELWSAVRTAVTDPARVRKDDPGNPNVCNVYALHAHFTDPTARAEIEVRCQTATIGCVQCKRLLADAIAARLAPVRERAAEFRARPALVREILGDGAARARAIAGPVLAEAGERMGLGAPPAA
ncbi:MAG: tryptophan--tRNA ligase [Gemmatimonadota bacterium]